MFNTQRYKFSLSSLVMLMILGMIPSSLFTQPWAGQGGGGSKAQMNVGRFYGKIVDEDGKGVSYASVQLIKMSFDTTTRSPKAQLIAGQITADNGDFSLEKLPVWGNFTLKVSVLGYADYEQEISFGLNQGGKGGGRPAGGGAPSLSGGRGGGSWGGGMSAMAGKFDKDLGNIKLTTEVMALDDVVIEGEGSTVTLALDKKVFRVDKNSVSVGGTAEDALANVPSLSVDIDGNLTLRNAAPQLFIDGRPTTLTLDQIAADEIESVEVITNPSAKYDASGGQAGIVNIVLKKERKIGYNGSIRGGVDTRSGYNAGGNINIREGKVNIFLSANLNSRASLGEGETFRQNLLGSPKTNILQANENQFVGRFTSLRGGVDWFIDNRNTITFSGSFTQGKFTPYNEIAIRTDSLFESGMTFSDAFRVSDSRRQFQNIGGSVLFKHLFPKAGREWTADISYNEVTSDGGGTFETDYATFSTLERQESSGGSQYITLQTDFVEPVNKNITLEWGARGAVRNYTNSNASYFYQDADWKRAPNFADEYDFTDAVYAAYGNFKHQFTKWGYMAGLRVESSQYTGELPERGDVFENDYPFSLFPSLFVTRKLNKQDNLQFSYSRRVNRPSFFRLMPFTDFSDSLNLRRGNPNLLPEFTNSFEATYQNVLSKGHDILVSAYFKQATDLITTFQTTEIIGGKEVLMTSYDNSNNSIAYGTEFTMRNNFTKNIELTTNVNLYNSRVDASNVQDGLINEQFTWFVKENLVIKLPAQFRLQINGQYQSKAAFTPSSGGRFYGWRGITNTAQGYTLPYWFVDVAVRKDLFKRKASLTVSMRDVFATRRTGTYTESSFFIQDSWRIRNPQVVSVNFSYRFGKPDISIFKRKNNNINMQGSDVMGG